MSTNKQQHNDQWYTSAVETFRRLGWQPIAGCPQRGQVAVCIAGLGWESWWQGGTCTLEVWNVADEFLVDFGDVIVSVVPNDPAIWEGYEDIGDGIRCRTIGPIREGEGSPEVEEVISRVYGMIRPD